MSALKSNKTYLSISQAANILGVSQDTLRRYEKKGLVSPIRSRGKKRLYTSSDLFYLQQLVDKPKTKELLGLDQTSKLLKVSKNTLRRWETEGKIKSTRTLGGHRRFSTEEIEKVKDTKHQPVSTITSHPVRACQPAVGGRINRLKCIIVFCHGFL